MILLNGCHRCSAERQVKAKAGQVWTELLLCVTQPIRQDSGAVGLDEVIKLFQMINMSTVFVSMAHSFLYVIKSVLNYAGSSGCCTPSHLLRPVLRISSTIRCRLDTG